MTWTVRDRLQVLRAAGMGVDWIVSDDTRLLVETLSSTHVPVTAETSLANQ